MKKLFLLVGLVVFLTPMVVSAETKVATTNSSFNIYTLIGTAKSHTLPNLQSPKSEFLFWKFGSGHLLYYEIIESKIVNNEEWIHVRRSGTACKKCIGWTNELDKFVKVVKKELSWLEKKQQDGGNSRLKKIILACENLGLESGSKELNECTLLFEGRGPLVWVGDTQYREAEILFCDAIITSNIISKNIYDCLDFFVENWKLQSPPIPPLTKANRKKAIKEKELALGRKLNFHEQTCMSSISTSGEISISERCMEQFEFVESIVRQQDSSNEPTEQQNKQSTKKSSDDDWPTGPYQSGYQQWRSKWGMYANPYMGIIKK